MRRIQVVVRDEVLDWLVAKVEKLSYGARELQRVVSTCVVAKLAAETAAHPAAVAGRIAVVVRDGQIRAIFRVRVHARAATTRHARSRGVASE